MQARPRIAFAPIRAICVQRIWALLRASSPSRVVSLESSEHADGANWGKSNQEHSAGSRAFPNFTLIPDLGSSRNSGKSCRGLNSNARPPREQRGDWDAKRCDDG